MILAVISGRRVLMTYYEIQIFEILLDYFAVQQVWTSGGSVGDGCHSIAAHRGLVVRDFQAECDGHHSKGAMPWIMNEMMLAELDRASRAGEHTSLLAFPGGAITSHFVDRALDRFIHVIDLRAVVHLASTRAPTDCTISLPTCGKFLSR